MNKVMVNLADRSYPIYIETDYNSIGKCLSACSSIRKIAVITDRNVDRCQADIFITALNTAGYDCLKYVLEAGEAF